jgi:hypothetical protein
LADDEQAGVGIGGVEVDYWIHLCGILAARRIAGVTCAGRASSFEDGSKRTKCNDVTP